MVELPASHALHLVWTYKKISQGKTFADVLQPASLVPSPQFPCRSVQGRVCMVTLEGFLGCNCGKVRVTWQQCCATSYVSRSSMHIAMQHHRMQNRRATFWLHGLGKNKTAELARIKKINAQPSPDPFPHRGWGLRTRLPTSTIHKIFNHKNLRLH